MQQHPGNAQAMPTQHCLGILTAEKKLWLLLVPLLIELRMLLLLEPPVQLQVQLQPLVQLLFLLVVTF